MPSVFIIVSSGVDFPITAEAVGRNGEIHISGRDVILKRGDEDNEQVFLWPYKKCQEENYLDVENCVVILN